MENVEYNDNEGQTQQGEKTTPNKRGGVFRFVVSLLSGKVMGESGFVKNIGFIVYVVLLLTLYIGYQYHRDGVVKEISILEKEREELDAQLNTALKDLNQMGLQSNIAEMVDELGLKELTEAPNKVYVDDGLIVN